MTKTCSFTLTLCLVLGLAAAPAFAELSPQARFEQLRPTYEALKTDPTFLDFNRRMEGRLDDAELVDAYLEFMPISPLDFLEIDMKTRFYEYGIPRFIAEWHARWIAFHEEQARALYGDAHVDSRLAGWIPGADAAGGIAKMATVGTNRNAASTFSPAPEEYQGEIQVMVNPNNPNQLVAAANTWDTIGGSCAGGIQAVFYSSDGGDTWGYTCPPLHTAYSLGNCSGTVFGSDPALAWNDDNEVFLNHMMICYISQANTQYAMVVARSANGGASWSAQGVIRNSWGSTTLEDKNFYIVDTTPTSPFYGRHYTCWDRNNNEKMAYSTNNGASWTEVDLPTSSGNGSGSRFDLGCDLAVGSNGTVHVVFNTLSCLSSCNNEEMFYTRSTNGGVSWSSPVEVRDFNLVAFSNNSCPDPQNSRCIGPFGGIAVDASGGACDGTLYATFGDFTSGNGNNNDVWVSRSTNNGTTWQAPVMVNDDGIANRAQFHSFVQVDRTNGDVVVGWHDARNDPGNDAIDYFVARSTDCGLTFEANIQVSQPSSEFNNSSISYSNENTADNPSFNPNQYGEYMGVDAHDGKAYLAWSDSRHFFPGFTGESQQENLGFAVVDFGDAGCMVNADCDDGAFCNGAEVCNAGSCEAGTAPDCDDGVACTVDSCNEGTDSCDHTATDSLCSNGLFCDGSETCDAVLGCQAGTPPDCDDGVACTIDSCNEGTDSCDNTPDDGACDDNLFCNGAETCDLLLGCQAGSDPCAPFGCDEVGDVCIGGPTAQLESGNVTAGGTAVSVALTNSYLSPVVVTSVQYLNNTTPVVPRVSAVTATGFDVRLQNPAGGAVAAETISYLVVEEGSWTIDGVAVEAQRYTSTVTDDAPSNWVGEAQSLAGSFTNPVVLGQVMSSNDADFSVFWDQGVARGDPPTAAALTTGKTVCEDTDTTRADETVGLVVFEAGHGTLGGVEYEAALGPDTVAGTANAPPYTYTFTTPFASAPTVAVTQMAGVDGNNGGWSQVHGATLATASSLFLSIDEDTIVDSERSHTTEQVAYLAFGGPVVFPVAGCVVDADCSDGLFCNGAEVCNAGTCEAGTPPDCDDGVACTVDACNEGTDSCDNTPTDSLCDNGLFCDGSETCDPVLGCQAGSDPCPGQNCDEVGDVCVPIGPQAQLEWGTVTVGASAVTVNLSNTYTSPVVVSAVHYDNNTMPVVTRISSLTGSSFAIRLQAAAAGTPVADTVSYLVVEEGSWTVDGFAIEAQTYNSTVTDENNAWVGQAQSLSGSFTNPVVLGQVMSSNDADWSVYWNAGAARTAPPTATALTAGKTVCEDTDTTRADETVGLVVIEAGHGTIGGVELEAALGADSVRGVGNAPPYGYDFGTVFAAAPSVAVVTMAGVDGGNGGWAQVHGATLATASTLFLSIDEDTIGDGERNHTPEQVGYLVFATAGVYP